jgi:large subunit ribosomal protein L21
MKYEVIALQGKQYKVAEGEEILVDKLATEKPVAEVLLFVDNDKVKIGKPVVKDVKVTLKVLTALEKGKKVEVIKYKSKSRYRRHTGFRAQLTRLEVTKISVSAK